MEVPEITDRRIIVDSCRRLTGPSLVWDETGAVLDLLIEELEFERVLDCWQRQLERVLQRLDWARPKQAHRRFENGFNLLLAAPVDQLYSAVLVLETCAYFCACELLGLETESERALIEAIERQMRQEKNGALLELQAEAARRGVDFLADDELVSIGHGKGSACYPADQIPEPGAIDWDPVHDIPVALVTGTNGKSTSVRLLDAIARAAGRVSGITSTDFVRVGDDILDRGDYSGPGGARLLLRDARLEVAFLEVARGGILRRGLPLRRARAALVTNVASDHLGQYGVNTLAALTATKFAVAKALAQDGVLVVNADDDGMVEYVAQNPRSNLCWFSLDKSNPRIQQQLEAGQRCCFSEQGYLVYFDGREAEQISAIDAIPMTLNGAAVHNVRNALGAIGVASAMDYNAAQIRAGLGQFNSDEADNPGRLNRFRLPNSAQVFVDFAHNAHSVAAVTETVRRLAARRKWILCGSAGDRSDADIAAIARGLCAIAPDRVVITELEDYLRGREPGEVSALMRDVFEHNGVAPERIHLADSPLAGVKHAVAGMESGDLGLFLVLSERARVLDYLRSL